MKATKFSQFLQSREELKFVDRPHWIYIAEAIIWSVIIIAVGIFANQFIATRIIYPALGQDGSADGLLINVAAWASVFALWGSIILAAFYFLSKLIFWASTYIFASDRRLYMKTGLMRVMVNEVNFDELRRTDINYGWFGRIIGYGKLMVDARFVEDASLPYMYNPEQFSKLIHYTNDLDSDVNLSYVTDGMRAKADKIVPKQSEVQEQVQPLHDQKQFTDHVFSDEEKENLKATGDNVHNDFEDAVDTHAHDINKPADTASPKKVKL